MQSFSFLRSALLLAFFLAFTIPLAHSQEPPSEAPPANVEGKWTIYAKAGNGETSTKYIELKQNGNTLSGHFKGPNQSGGLEGTVNGQTIMFRTKTKWVFTFRGRVEGDKIQGTFHDRRGQGEWQAVRSQQ